MSMRTYIRRSAHVCASVEVCKCMRFDKSFGFWRREVKKNLYRVEGASGICEKSTLCSRHKR